MDIILGFALILLGILARLFDSKKLSLLLAGIGTLLIIVTLARCSAVLTETSSEMNELLQRLE